VFSAQIFQENTFLKTKSNFPLSGKCFPLTNFSNGKQTQESLESDFSDTTFRKTNTAKRENTFMETKPNFSLTGKCFPLTGKCFPLTGKCFPLTNFSYGKQTQKSLESGFPETTFRETNMALVKLGDIITEISAPLSWSWWAEFFNWMGVSIHFPITHFHFNQPAGIVSGLYLH